MSSGGNSKCILRRAQQGHESREESSDKRMRALDSEHDEEERNSR